MLPSVFNISLSICQKNGWSALFFAADEGDVATTKLLLDAGADPLLRDNVRKCKRDYCRNDYSITILLSLVFQSGLTAVDVASAGENDDVYGLLRNHIMRTTNTLQSRVSQVWNSSIADENLYFVQISKLYL